MLRSACSASISRPLRADKVKEEGRKHFLKSGLKWFDEWLGGGARRQELEMYSAVPHGGKTHLLCWTVGQFILGGFSALYMAGEDLMSDIKYYCAQTIRNKQAIKNLWLYDVVDSHFGVSEVEASIGQMKEEGHDPDIIVVDNVDVMYGHGKSDVESLTNICRDLKMLAKRTNKVIWTASQQGFGKEQRGMARLYGAKVGKAKNLDLLVMVNNAYDDEYDVTLEKARGRRIKYESRNKMLRCDWDEMEIEDIT
jgi:predicted ATP-dependent serine protease